MAEQDINETPNIGIAIDTDELAWFDDSPSAGDPACICSYCGNVIEEFEVPIRLFRRRENTEARLCETCMDVLIR